MKKYVVALLLTGCVVAHAQSCEYCGEWRYSGFEYASHITTDCQDIAHDFENANITIGEHFFRQTYSIDNRQKQIDDIDTIEVSVDEYENVPVILMLKGSKVVQKLYVAAPNMTYIFSDGCRLYFMRED